jgi:hypothetical protein
MSDESELKRRIRELEEENARLRSSNSRAVEYIAWEDTYEGHPILVFERPNGKSFKLGLGKLQAIRACFHKVEEFLHRHGKNSAGITTKANYSDDEKI